MLVPACCLRAVDVRKTIGRAVGKAVKVVRTRVGTMPGYLGGMFSHTTELRVRYGETDKMGYVYYGDYAEYFEVGRVEALRSLGFPYKRLEEEGVMLPVREMQVRYHRAAGYDDLLTLRTTIVEPPSARITFRNELFDEDGGLIAEATITLVFVDADTRRPRKAPSALLQALASYFS